MARGSAGSADVVAIDPPRGWAVDMAGRKITTFRNADRGLEVIVRAVFSGSKHRAGRRDPVHYVVRMHADGFATEPDRTEDRSAMAPTREEAFDLAESFMERSSPDPA